METKTKKLMVYHSPSTNRVCFNARDGMCVTGVIENGKMNKLIHSAPIPAYNMIKSFTNEHIDDWKIKSINTWSEL